MKENKIVKLSDVCDLIPGFAFKSSEFGEHKVKAVKIGDIQPPYVNFESMTGVDISKYSVSRLAKYEIFKGDFVLAMTGATIGKIGRYIADTGAYINQRVLKFKPHDEVNSVFIYYVVSSTSFQKYILNNVDSETAQPNISAGSVGKYEFELPSLEEQNRIANILASIDNKIQLNRQINDNLEQQLQLLYREWFIENPKPEWPSVNLSEIATFISGYSYKGNELVENSYTAMATIKNFERNGGFKIDGYKPIVPSSKLKIEQRAQLFDILVAHTDLTQNAEVIGNAEILLSKDRYKDLIFSMDLVKVNVKESFPFQFLLALLLKNPRFKSHCIGYVNGTTVLHMNKRALPDYETIIPNSEDAQSLNATAKAIFCHMSENLTEISNLTKMRDTLLPRLMSGELKINNLDC